MLYILGIPNKDLPNSWECPKCIKSGNTSKLFHSPRTTTGSLYTQSYVNSLSGDGWRQSEFEMERSSSPELKRPKLEPLTSDVVSTHTPSTSSSTSNEFEKRFKHWQKEQQRRQFEQFSRPSEVSTSTGNFSAKHKQFGAGEIASTSSGSANSAAANSTSNFLKTFPLLSSSLSLGGPASTSTKNNEDTLKIKDGKFLV